MKRDTLLFPTRLVCLACLAIGVGCVALGHGSIKLAADEHPAKYILILGDGGSGHVKYRSREKFIQALAQLGPAEWHTTLAVSDSANPGDIPERKPGTPSSVVLVGYTKIAQTTVDQNGQEKPCTLHVTQKVGLNKLGQMKSILSALAP